MNFERTTITPDSLINLSSEGSMCIYGGNRNMCTGATEIDVEKRIEIIQQREFYGWKSLINVSFPDDSALTSIEEYSFAECSNLKYINFPPKLECIKDSAFLKCSSLTNVHLSGSLNILAGAVFNTCNSLAELTVDEDIKVTTINGYCFQYSLLVTFAIWKSLTVISASAFICTGFREYTNPYNNPAFTVINGSLYSGTTFVALPCSQTGDFVVPPSVTTIAPEAFRCCMLSSISFASDSQCCQFSSSCIIFAAITSFAFPNNTMLTRISDQMFYSCQNLKYLTIPNSITAIGERAFFKTGILKFVVALDHPCFTSVGGILYNKNMSDIIACPRFLQVENFVIPKNVTRIAPSAFCMSMIPNITFEKGSRLTTLSKESFNAIYQSSFAFDPDCPLAEIPENCFVDSTKLKTVFLPRGLQSMIGSAFSGTGVTEFIIPIGAPYLVSLDGVLYSIDKTTLFRYPTAKSGNYEVPPDVVTVASFGFAACSALQSLRFAKDSKLQSICSQAFAESSIESVTFGENSDDVTFQDQCFTKSKVKHVTLPGNMCIIKYNLFKDCFDLEEIVLPATTASIEVGAFTNCESLAKLVIPKYCKIRIIPVGAFTNTRSLTALELPYLVESVDRLALPANLETITLWCPLTASVATAVGAIPNLQNLYVLCSVSVNTTNFVSQTITVHRMCATNKLAIRKNIRFAWFWFVEM